MAHQNPTENTNEFCYLKMPPQGFNQTGKTWISLSLIQCRHKCQSTSCMHAKGLKPDHAIRL